MSIKFNFNSRRLHHYCSCQNIELLQVILDIMILLQSSRKPTINMVVLGTIDIESSLLNTDDLIPTGCETARELFLELERNWLINFLSASVEE